MTPFLVPERRRGIEYLDDPSTSPEVRARSLADVRVSNRLLGGLHAVLAEVGRIAPALGDSVSVLDVGTGLADVPVRVRALLAKRKVTVELFGVDEAPSLARHNLAVLDGSVCGDARYLPFRSSSIDLVICSQMLHHLEDREIGAVLAELDRVARTAVIVSDLRRSWFAAIGFWLVSQVLRFHPVTRHDGVVSVLRGFTSRELGDAVRTLGRRPVVRRHPGFRLTATWSPVS